MLPSKKDSAKPVDLTPDDLNTFFTNIGNRIVANNPRINPSTVPDINVLPNPTKFTFEPIEPSFVMKELVKLTDKPNIDILGMDAKLMYYGANHLAKPLAHIFNLSLQASIVPCDWKIA